MTYRVIDIEGVGELYAAKLGAAGVDTVEQLLERCKTPQGREALALETGISPKLILRWTNHADLFRIKGVGPQFAELLEATGVDTVKEFRHRRPDNLHTRLVEVNTERNLCGRVPSEKELTAMIQQAATLEPMVTYYPHPPPYLRPVQPVRPLRIIRNLRSLRRLRSTRKLECSEISEASEPSEPLSQSEAEPRRARRRTWRKHGPQTLQYARQAKMRASHIVTSPSFVSQKIGRFPK